MDHSTKRRMYSINAAAALIVSATTLGTQNAAAHSCVNDISGGLTKDAVYLRGLRQILDYLGNGGELEPLFAGKLATEHVPIIRELIWRGVLVAPPLIPRYLEWPEARARLERLRQGLAVVALVERRRR